MYAVQTATAGSVGYNMLTVAEVTPKGRRRNIMYYVRDIVESNLLPWRVFETANLILAGYEKMYGSLPKSYSNELVARVLVYVASTVHGIRDVAMMYKPTGKSGRKLAKRFIQVVYSLEEDSGFRPDRIGNRFSIEKIELLARELGVEADVLYANVIASARVLARADNPGVRRLYMRHPLRLPVMMGVVKTLLLRGVEEKSIIEALKRLRLDRTSKGQINPTAVVMLVKDLMLYYKS